MLVHDFVVESAKKFPSKEALVCGESRLTYKQIHHYSNSFANALRATDFKRQHTALIYLDNCSELVVSLFGILKASGIFTVISPVITPQRLNYMLNDSQATTLITDSKNLKKIRTILPHVSHITHVILIDKDPSVPYHVILGPDIEVTFYQDIIYKYSNLEPICTSIDVDLASIIYTSGSTNFCKGVMLTHANMVAAAHSIVSYLKNTRNDVIFTCLPLAFDYSLYNMLTAFFVGAKSVIEQNFLYPAHIIDILVQEQVTGFAIVPTIAALLKEHDMVQRYDFSHLRYLCSSAQTLPKSSIEYLRLEMFPNTDIYSMYGLTECKSVSGLDPEKIDIYPESVGKALPNMEVYVIDEHGKKHWYDAEGELVVRGSNVMKGYLHNPEETQKKLIPGDIPGEFHLRTGDLFHIDAKGYLYFKGRLDNMINAAGIQIAPKAIEDVLYEVDGVLEAAVFGQPHPIWGEAIKAVVSIKEGKQVTTRMLRTYCFEHLERVSVPHIIEIVDSLPKKDNGKIDIKALIT